MSLAKYNEQRKAEAAAKLAAEGAEQKPEVQNTSTAAPIPETGTPEETAAQMAANLSGIQAPTPEQIAEVALAILESDTEDQTEYAELSDWVSPLDVNYKELESILDGKKLSDYVGDRLPEEEVKRIETDYKLYLKNK